MSALKMMATTTVLLTFTRFDQSGFYTNVNTMEKAK